MKVKFISNEYIFKNGEKDMMIATMRYIENIATVEFKLNNKMMYYFLLTEENIQGLNDLDIINEAVLHMKDDKHRWITDCQYYLENCEKFVLQERLTSYRVTIDKDKKHYCTVSILEENDNKFVIRMKDELYDTVVTTHMSAKSRDHLLDTMEGLYKTIIDVIKLFRGQEEQIILNGFGSDYVLQKKIEKLHD